MHVQLYFQQAPSSLCITGFHEVQFNVHMQLMLCNHWLLRSVVSDIINTQLPSQSLDFIPVEHVFTEGSETHKHEGGSSKGLLSNPTFGDERLCIKMAV